MNQLLSKPPLPLVKFPLDDSTDPGKQENNSAFILLIIYMKKLLDSDWLRAVQFKCNTSAKSVKPLQITAHNSDYD